MEARSADIQRPDTNWLRTTARRAVAVTALTAAMIGPADKAGAADPTPTPKVGANTAKAQPSTEGCQWSNAPDKRQPISNTLPVTVQVDGSCDPDPAAPIGIYPAARQEGQPLALVKTGDPLTVDCYIPNGDLVQDGRDDAIEGDRHIASSTVWLRVKAPDGTLGNIPTTWTGFTDPITVAARGLHECR